MAAHKVVLTSLEAVRVVVVLPGLVQRLVHVLAVLVRHKEVRLLDAVLLEEVDGRAREPAVGDDDGLAVGDTVGAAVGDAVASHPVA